MISVEDFNELGMIDVSPDKNGFAYRIRINGIIEVCYYMGDPHIRLQSVGSGFTHSLIGVKTKDELKAFIFALQGKK